MSQIDAAVIALNGSLMTDNYNRGDADGQHDGHRRRLPVASRSDRPAVGGQADDTGRVSSGYVLQNSYLDLKPANLPYVPA